MTFGLPTRLPDLVVHGELVLISVAIAADAISDLLGSSRISSTRRNVSIGGCFIIVFVSAFYFSDVSLGTKANPETVFHTSLWIFGITLVVSLISKALAGMGQ
jgi:hypothetical protein